MTGMKKLALAMPDSMLFRQLLPHSIESRSKKEVELGAADDLELFAKVPPQLGEEFVCVIHVGVREEGGNVWHGVALS